MNYEVENERGEVVARTKTPLPAKKLAHAGAVKSGNAWAVRDAGGIVIYEVWPDSPAPGN